MQFFSFDFYLFFLAVFFLNWFLKKWPFLWRAFLLLVSYLFYSFWSINFLFVIIGITALNYLSGELIWRYEKKWILFLSIFLNILILGIFKYYDFFRIELERFFNIFGLNQSFPVFAIIFPIGLSFYILRAISYNIDIFRKQLRPIYSLLDFAIYISFFPQLISGPIARANDFFPQIQDSGAKEIKDFYYSGSQILLGLFKKLVISSYLTLEITDKVFAVPQNYNWSFLLMGVYAYAIVIYCDFSGYSDMAIGISGLLGFQTKKNFDNPYLALDIQDFWRRWHISLSTWFRDYLYIPLGGMNVSKIRLYFNIMITMIISGLWHGANMTFLFWGFLHGLAMIVFRVIKSTKDKVAQIEVIEKNFYYFKNIIKNFWNWLLTFNFVSFAWIFFRADSVKTGFQIIDRIFSFAGKEEFNFKIAYAILICIIFFFIGKKVRERILAEFKKIHWIFQIIIVWALLIAIIIMAPNVVPPFIYSGF